MKGILKMGEEKKTLTTVALVLGILALVFDFVYTLIGIILGIIGIVIAVQARKTEGNSSMATGGLVCSIVAVALGGAMYLCAICAIGALFGVIDTL